MSSQRLGIIAFVLDSRLSRERAKLLTRTVNHLRTFAQIELIDGQIDEEKLVEKLGSHSYSLVLLPWYRYLSWKRIEAFYGLTRTSGPTTAGYYADPVLPYELGEQTDALRAILLDFASLAPTEAGLLVRALISDGTRSGIRPLLEPGTTIHCETWFGGQGLGGRIDSVLALPEIKNTDWIQRASALRIGLSALWSLIYEDGPGKSDFGQSVSSKNPKAYFQISVDRNAVIFRLCYSMVQWPPKDVIKTFWPDPARPTSAGQLLSRYADFVRVHTVADHPEVEVVVGFFASAGTERHPAHAHSLWVEPISPQLVREIPATAPEGADQKPLVAAQAFAGSGNSEIKDKFAELSNKERLLIEAVNKIRELRREIAERDDMIRELRSGGIGTAKPLPPTDVEGLLEAFQERFFESKFQIRQLELDVLKAQQQGASQEELNAIQQRMALLMNRQKEWIRKLGGILQNLGPAQRPSGTGT